MPTTDDLDARVRALEVRAGIGPGYNDGVPVLTTDELSEGLTKAELLVLADELGVEGTSRMNKDELAKAIADAEGKG